MVSHSKPGECSRKTNTHTHADMRLDVRVRVNVHVQWAPTGMHCIEKHLMVLKLNGSIPPECV